MGLDPIDGFQSLFYDDEGNYKKIGRTMNKNIKHMRKMQMKKKRSTCS